MQWSLAIVALALLGVAAVSRRLAGSAWSPRRWPSSPSGSWSAPMFSMGSTWRAQDPCVRTLAEATLTLVLFSDASRIDLGQLRRSLGVPSRLLGIGLPLTIALGALIAGLLFDQLTIGEAAILGVILAPTDAALGQAVVTEPRVPGQDSPGPQRRERAQRRDLRSSALRGCCGCRRRVAYRRRSKRRDSAARGDRLRGARGSLAGALIAVIVIQAGRRDLIEAHWRQVIPAAGAALAYGIAVGLDGSGFIAAFVAGIVFRALLGRDPAELNDLAEEVGDLLGGVTFLLFGAICSVGR